MFLPSSVGDKASVDRVDQLLSQLKDDLTSSSASPTRRRQLLEELKVLGRRKDISGSIYAKDGMSTLGRYAFEMSEAEVSQEALRCIANALLLEPCTRQLLVDLGYGPNAADKFASTNIDDEFLLARVLLLTTYNTSLDFRKLLGDHKLAGSINAALHRHSKRYSNSTRRLSQEHVEPMELMALSETLKLLFNITHFYPDLSGQFSSSIPDIYKILTRRKLPSPPLEAPVNYLINALINLDLEDKQAQQQDSPGMSATFPAFNNTCNAERLIEILDKALSAYPERELDNAVSPVLTLIRRIYEIAPEDVKKHMEKLVLPTDEERDQPLGKSDTLSSRLLRLSTSALTPGLRSSISAMMFELSGKDATTFIQNVGYGFASGFLVSNNIPMPENAMEGHATVDPARAVPVNPITGQRIDREQYDESEPMTEEEREREAERLFVLFERLRATGVVDVQNPVEEAYRSGRIQELPDDADD